MLVNAIGCHIEIGDRHNYMTVDIRAKYNGVTNSKTKIDYAGRQKTTPVSTLSKGIYNL